LKFHHKEGVR